MEEDLHLKIRSLESHRTLFLKLQNILKEFLNDLQKNHPKKAIRKK